VHIVRDGMARNGRVPGTFGEADVKVP